MEAVGGALLSLCDSPGWGVVLGSCLFSSHVSGFLLFLLHHGNGSDDFFLSAFFCVLCLTASSPKSFPPPGSSLSCLGPDSSSPRSPWPALASGPNSRKQVTLLPPFLSDQAQKVQALGTFYLFCQATGELRGLSVHGCPLALPLLLTAPLAVPEVQLSVLSSPLIPL